jgi:hypothetical protein
MQDERKDMKGLSGIVLPFQIEIILSARYTFGISELG